MRCSNSWQGGLSLVPSWRGGVAGVLRSSEVKLYLHCAPAPGVGEGRVGCRGGGVYLSPSPTTPPGTNLAGSRHKLPRVTRQPVPSRCHGPRTLIPSLPKPQGPSWHIKDSSGLLRAVVGADRGAGAWPGSWWSCCRAGRVSLLCLCSGRPRSGR